MLKKRKFYLFFVRETDANLKPKNAIFRKRKGNANGFCLFFTENDRQFRS